MDNFPNFLNVILHPGEAPLLRLRERKSRDRGYRMLAAPPNIDQEELTSAPLSRSYTVLRLRDIHTPDIYIKAKVVPAPRGPV